MTDYPTHLPALSWRARAQLKRASTVATWSMLNARMRAKQPIKPVTLPALQRLDRREQANG